MPLVENYQSLSAADKLQELWSRILASAYPITDLPDYRTVPFYAHALSSGLLSEPYLKRTFDTCADEMPPGRTKIIHTYGTVACTEIVPVPGHPFTGVFRSGARGLTRLSLAFPDAGNFCPGMGHKCLIDGQPSVNTVAMPSLLGQGDDHNFFARAFLNPAPTEVGNPAEVILRTMFTKTADSYQAKVMRWNHMPFSEWAARSSDGVAVANPVCPWGLRLEPAPETQLSSVHDVDYRVKLAAFPAGTRLFSLMMNAAPDGEWQHVADLRTTTQFVASRWGDEGLFFQHPVGPVT